MRLSKTTISLILFSLSLPSLHRRQGFRLCYLAPTTAATTIKITV